MIDSINQIFEKGLLLQTFEVEKNLLIWQYVAEEVALLEIQSGDVKSLFSFVQQSAQTNFVLALGKLYDNQKKYPTQCILYFLRQVKDNANSGIDIIEKRATQRLLTE